MEFPQKLKIDSSYDPEYISIQNYNSKRHMHLYVQSNTVPKSQDMEIA